MMAFLQPVDVSSPLTTIPAQVRVVYIIGPHRPRGTLAMPELAGARSNLAQPSDESHRRFFPIVPCRILSPSSRFYEGGMLCLSKRRSNAHRRRSQTSCRWASATPSVSASSRPDSRPDSSMGSPMAALWSASRPSPQSPRSGMSGTTAGDCLRRQAGGGPSITTTGGPIRTSGEVVQMFA